MKAGMEHSAMTEDQSRLRKIVQQTLLPIVGS